jgi:hypothetical protein
MFTLTFLHGIRHQRRRSRLHHDDVLLQPDHLGRERSSVSRHVCISARARAE